MQTYILHPRLMPARKRINFATMFLFVAALVIASLMFAVIVRAWGGLKSTENDQTIDPSSVRISPMTEQILLN